MWFSHGAKGQASPARAGHTFANQKQPPAPPQQTARSSTSYEGRPIGAAARRARRVPERLCPPCHRPHPRSGVVQPWHALQGEALALPAAVSRHGSGCVCAAPCRARAHGSAPPGWDRRAPAGPASNDAPRARTQQNHKACTYCHDLLTAVPPDRSPPALSLGIDAVYAVHDGAR